ncbi:hypothetical protein J2Z21_004699 [Streptomyces griseochromogenes]|uniref:Uncharacterized protein n=1 Tax=Streptomyces griseochromogenes TaxID=68214 RepID=A0ABS4LWX1_9ACTN|nr:hypothetical protein [Streptomyces griseochromogenes]
MNPVGCVIVGAFMMVITEAPAAHPLHTYPAATGFAIGGD